MAKRGEQLKFGKLYKKDSKSFIEHVTLPRGVNAFLDHNVHWAVFEKETFN